MTTTNDPTLASLRETRLAAEINAAEINRVAHKTKLLYEILALSDVLHDELTIVEDALKDLGEQKDKLVAARKAIDEIETDETASIEQLQAVVETATEALYDEDDEDDCDLCRGLEAAGAYIFNIVAAPVDETSPVATAA